MIATMTQLQNLALLVLRLGFGGTMMLAHGWSKLQTFNENSATFPDPLGVGSVVSLILTVFSEFFCALLVCVGLGTRFAASVLAFTMVVAFFKIHADDPFMKKELAWMYLMGFLPLIAFGSGRFGVDSFVRWQKRG